MKTLKITLMTLLVLAGFSFATCKAQGTVGADLEVKATIEALFKGLKEKGPEAIKAAFTESALLETVKTDAQANSVERVSVEGFVNSIAAIPPEMKIEERLLDYEIKTEGAMASAWTPYEFYINGKLSHCGVNSFQLVKLGGKWKIVYIIDTRRKEGC
ncbi:nuclear transport factor 2 family protein [Echinicola soli]|uniref:Nuclear transport factor 2 family protein n=1 Tax=Echinicola soli TaxID=2591634 RepID=A0A514CHF6_9BACT|nr:nuclear transport factor 2 family protein [Echinicola soli]QDH79253.1 nuclear transport factor 2 family protein [Echinicola soli]